MCFDENDKAHYTLDSQDGNHLKAKTGGSHVRQT